MILIPNNQLTLSRDLSTSREVRREVMGCSQGTWECLEVRISKYVVCDSQFSQKIKIKVPQFFLKLRG